jgi:hypothetical protein
VLCDVRGARSGRRAAERGFGRKEGWSVMQRVRVRREEVRKWRRKRL